MWSNLELKARNIGFANQLNTVAPKDLSVFLEWVEGIAGNIFEKLTKAQLQELVKGSEYYEYAEAEPLFFQGSPGKHYFVVLRGRVKVLVLQSESLAVRRSKMYLRKKSWVVSNSKSGSPRPADNVVDILGQTVAVMLPGRGFGQIALISLKDPIRNASCVADMNQTGVLKVPKALYNKFLKHLHVAERSLDERVKFLQTVHLFKLWHRPQLMNIAFNLTEENYGRGEIVLAVNQDGKKAFKGIEVTLPGEDSTKRQDAVDLGKRTSNSEFSGAEKTNDNRIELILVKEGLVEYGEYPSTDILNGAQKDAFLNATKADGGFVRLASCGPGRMFAIPGGDIFSGAHENGSQHNIVIRALKKTKIYCLYSNYFASNISNGKRTNMLSTKAMLRRQESKQMIALKDRLEKFVLSTLRSEGKFNMRYTPVKQPISKLEMGKLEAEYPYPVEQPFRDAPALTFKQMRDFDENKFAHVEEVRGCMEYKNIHTLPPWGSGTPIRMINKLRKHKQELRLKKKVALDSIGSSLALSANVSSDGKRALDRLQSERNDGTGSNQKLKSHYSAAESVFAERKKLSEEEAVASPVERLTKLQHLREMQRGRTNLDIAFGEEAKKSSQPQRGYSQNTSDRNGSVISWRQKEPEILLKTKTFMKNFRTKDTERILMGIRLD